MAELVKAIFDFVRSNNDELSFRKGDLITVTQKIEGGWWEGTLKNETGWFPVNLVEAYQKENGQNGTGDHQDMRPIYRKQVLSNLIESERQHVREMQAFERSFMKPLEASALLTPEEFSTLSGNFSSIVQLHAGLLSSFEDILKTPSEHQAVGAVFMSAAADMRDRHLEYCSNHPDAVEALNQSKNVLLQFCQSLGIGMNSKSPMIYLTTELSRPFRRLDKYPSMLQELERHMEDFNSDRGNVQRSVRLYTAIANECTDRRRQKESEQEILKGNIQGYSGPAIETLGKIVSFEQVAEVRRPDSSGSATRDRFLVLFSNGLLVLEASKRMSSFVFSKYFALVGLEISPCEQPSHTIELSSKTTEPAKFAFKTDLELDTWLSKAREQIRKQNARLQASTVYSNTLPKPVRAKLSGTTASPKHEAVTVEQTVEPVLPKGISLKPPIITNSVWSGSCLRPHPPLQPDLPSSEKLNAVGQSPKLPRRFSSKRKDPVRVEKKGAEYSVDMAKQHEDDMALLAVIDAYCISSKARQISSEVLDSPHVLIPEEEKIFIEGAHGGLLEERSLVDTVYSLRDEVSRLSKELVDLRRILVDERKLREKSESNGMTDQLNGSRPTQSLVL